MITPIYLTWLYQHGPEAVRPQIERFVQEVLSCPNVSTGLLRLRELFNEWECASTLTALGFHRSDLDEITTRVGDFPWKSRLYPLKKADAAQIFENAF